MHRRRQAALFDSPANPQAYITTLGTDDLIRRLEVGSDQDAVFGRLLEEARRTGYEECEEHAEAEREEVAERHTYNMYAVRESLFVALAQVQVGQLDPEAFQKRVADIHLVMARMSNFENETFSDAAEHLELKIPQA